MTTRAESSRLSRLTFYEQLRELPIQDVLHAIGAEEAPRGRDKWACLRCDSSDGLHSYEHHAHCFSCGAHLSPLDAAMAKLGLSLRAAAIWLAERFGIPVPRGPMEGVAPAPPLAVPMLSPASLTGLALKVWQDRAPGERGTLWRAACRAVSAQEEPALAECWHRLAIRDMREAGKRAGLQAPGMSRVELAARWLATRAAELGAEDVRDAIEAALRAGVPVLEIPAEEAAEEPAPDPPVPARGNGRAPEGSAWLRGAPAWGLA